MYRNILYIGLTSLSYLSNTLIIIKDQRPASKTNKSFGKLRIVTKHPSTLRTKINYNYPFL